MKVSIHGKERSAEIVKETNSYIVIRLQSGKCIRINKCKNKNYGRKTLQIKD